jgi:8-oxo-dGTP pyrophosphatase MutT (NUDIX family)
MSPYISALRSRVGSMRLLLPAVGAHLFDDQGRLLLVHQRTLGLWSTPGGLVEPDESPAGAVVRETWEEIGVHVRPERIVGVYGGPECVVRYANGHETQYVITAFGCTIVDGSPRPDGDEIDDLRWCARADIGSLPVPEWLRANAALVWQPPHSPPGFRAAAWAPTTGW